MALSRYDPLSLVAADPFSSLLGYGGGGFGGGALAMPNVMKVDIKETPSEFAITADAPGMPKEGIKVTVDGDVLTLEASRDEEKTDADAANVWHKKERHWAYAKRSLRMPSSADLGKVECKYEAGSIHITVPKLAEEKGRAREVEIK